MFEVIGTIILGAVIILIGAVIGVLARIALQASRRMDGLRRFCWGLPAL
jgi:hypothetical protein